MRPLPAGFPAAEAAAAARAWDPVAGQGPPPAGFVPTEYLRPAGSAAGTVPRLGRVEEVADVEVDMGAEAAAAVVEVEVAEAAAVAVGAEVAVAVDAGAVKVEDAVTTVAEHPTAPAPGGLVGGASVAERCGPVCRPLFLSPVTAAAGSPRAGSWSARRRPRRGAWRPRRPRRRLAHGSIERRSCDCNFYCTLETIRPYLASTAV